MSSLESVDCIFQFFGDGPQFAVVKLEEYTCNICIESSEFDFVADFSAVNNFIQCFDSIYCNNFSAVGGFNQSPKRRVCVCARKL